MVISILSFLIQYSTPQGNKKEGTDSLTLSHVLFFTHIAISIESILNRKAGSHKHYSTVLYSTKLHSSDTVM